MDRPSSVAQRVVTRVFEADLLANHVPRAITPRWTQDADLILVMETSLLNPKVLPMDKTFLLRSFFGEVGDIGDPFRGSDEKYWECAQELQRILKTNLPRLIDSLRPAP